MTEAAIEAKLVRYAKSKGVLTFKFSSPSNRGVPDRVFMCNGKVLFLELKREGEVPTALQFHTMKKITDMGVTCDWCDNVRQGKASIDALAYAVRAVSSTEDR